jgi:hypothetical protein
LTAAVSTAGTWTWSNQLSTGNSFSANMATFFTDVDVNNDLRD